MDSIDYSRYMRRALQRLVGDVLGDVAEHGLPGDHHFYISFITKMPGVQMPAHLRVQYPEEMTIVMQGWFDNLGVLDDRFAVTLSFSGVAEDLVIPFDAIIGFADPSVDFSLRLDSITRPTAEVEEESGEPVAPTPRPDPGGAGGAGPSKVIQLDRFRGQDRK